MAYNTFYMNSNLLPATEPTDVAIKVISVPTTPGNPTQPGNPSRPGNPTEPSNPTKPENPTTPEKPTTPATPETTGPTTPESQTPTTSTTPKPTTVRQITQVTPESGTARHSVTRTSKQTAATRYQPKHALPQTNERQANEGSIIGLALLGLLSAFGWARQPRRKH